MGNGVSTFLIKGLASLFAGYSGNSQLFQRLFSLSLDEREAKQNKELKFHKFLLSILIEYNIFHSVNAYYILGKYV